MSKIAITFILTACCILFGATKSDNTQKIILPDGSLNVDLMKNNIKQPDCNFIKINRNSSSIINFTKMNRFGTFKTSSGDLTIVSHPEYDSLGCPKPNNPLLKTPPRVFPQNMPSYYTKGAISIWHGNKLIWKEKYFSDTTIVDLGKNKGILVLCHSRPFWPFFSFVIFDSAHNKVAERWISIENLGQTYLINPPEINQKEFVFPVTIPGLLSGMQDKGKIIINRKSTDTSEVYRIKWTSK